MIRVAIVDDHPVVRQGLRSILARVPDVEVVADVADPTELANARGDRVDVVLCDPYPFAGTPRPEVIRELSTWVPVLVMSARCDGADVMTAMRYGARGFLSKHASGEAYVSAIRSVVAGAAFVGPAPLADRRSDRSNARALSEREQLALAFIAGGFTHQQTARRMGVSKATVDTYVGRIRTKLRVGNKAELALAALRHVDPMYRQTVSQCR